MAEWEKQELVTTVVDKGSPEGGREKKKWRGMQQTYREKQRRSPISNSWNL